MLFEPQFALEDGHLDLSLRDTERWGYPEGMGVANGTYVHIGDDTCGPVMFFFTVIPGIELPESPAHGHASDNWRMSMRGVLPMGPERYHAGDFRFQQGWKPYGSDQMATGPDGGWSLLVFADRRGTKIRPVRPEEGGFPDERVISDWAHLKGDQVSDLPEDGAGPAGLATTTGRIRGGHVNGSFQQSAQWPEVRSGVRMLATLMGDKTCGPVMVLVDAEPGSVVVGARTLGTEVVRTVIDGSCTIGDQSYGAGDIRIDEAGASSNAVIAGDDGLKEIVLFGDRRALLGENRPISRELGGVINELARELSATPN
jgi:hypothetical protein